MVIQYLVSKEQNFVTDPVLHGKPVQFSQHETYMVKLAPFRRNPVCIILAAQQSVDVGLFCSIW